jgi:TolB-like protein
MNLDSAFFDQCLECERVRSIAVQMIPFLDEYDATRAVGASSRSVFLNSLRPGTLPQIARELSVDAIVERPVRRDGDRVLITVGLIEARTDQHLWTESYGRDLSDILNLQSQVAAAIASEIREPCNSKEKWLSGIAYWGNHVSSPCRWRESVKPR